MDFSPVPANQHAIVWEIRPEEARGALFEFGIEQKIVLVRDWRATRGAPLPSFLKVKRFRRVPIVLSLHPSLSRTFLLPFRLKRKKNDSPLSPEDFQSQLREFLDKTTLEMRRLAAKDLDIGELDAILLDARLESLLVDDVDSRDDRPIQGTKIEGSLRVTFTTREVFHDLHDLLHSGRDIFITERGPAGLTFLARCLPGKLTFLDIDDSGGWIFSLDNSREEIIKKEQFLWSSFAPVQSLVEAWGLSSETSLAAYGRFLAGDFSGKLERFAKKLFAVTVDDFEKVLADSSAAGEVFLRAPLPPPFKLPASIGKVRLVPLPMESLLEKAGVKMQLSSSEFQKMSFLILPFLEYYYHRGGSLSHKALKKQIHWISA